MPQLLELAVVRETLQSRLLVEIMGAAMHKELVLKGGMAMRAVHGSVRYTKDIDLDADLKHSKDRVQGIVRRSIDRAISFGLITDAKVSEPKQTETTLRWKIVGTQPGSDAPMNLTVEVSRRAIVTGGHVIEVPLAAAHGAAPGTKVQVLDSQAITVTKVLALTDPKRMAPRDLYDLHVLIEANVKDPSHLLASLPDASVRLPRAMAELWPKIESMTFAQFRSDVIPYLPPVVAGAIDEGVFDDMRLQVGTSVERWLQAANEDARVTPVGIKSVVMASGAPGPAGPAPTAERAPAPRRDPRP